MFVTCIGLNQIWSSQFQRIFKPHHYLIAGGAGPLGWDLPAALGAKIAHPENLTVNVVGDYGLGFCGEELAMAMMYNIPVVIIVINNGYLGLIRQQEKFNFNMNFEVSTWYDGTIWTSLSGLKLMVLMANVWKAAQDKSGFEESCSFKSPGCGRNHC